MNKNNGQTVGDRDFNIFFARDQRFFKAKIKQKNEIDDINYKKTRDETNAEDECSKNDRFDM